MLKEICEDKTKVDLSAVKQGRNQKIEAQLVQVQKVTPPTLATQVQSGFETRVPGFKKRGDNKKYPINIRRCCH